LSHLSDSRVILANLLTRGPLFYLYNARYWPLLSYAVKDLIKMDSLPSEIILYVTTCKLANKAFELLATLMLD